MIQPLALFQSWKTIKVGSNAKPLRLSYARRLTSRKQTSWLVLVALAVVMVVLSICRTRPTALFSTDKQQQQHDIDDPPSICSHQLLHAPQGAVDGSLDALRAFWQASVHCFDIDIVTLADGNMVVSHPRRLQPYIRAAAAENNIDQADLTLIRQVGANAVAFPLLSQVLEEYARLLTSTTTSDPTLTFSSSTTRHNLPLPLLNLDIKESPHLTQSLMSNVVDQIRRLNIQSYVAFCVTHGEQLHSLLLNNNADDDVDDDIQWGLVLRDQVSQDWEWDRLDQILMTQPLIRFVIPSLHFSAAWFEQLHARRLASTVWTVDTWQDWQQARQRHGISAVIANRPMDFLTPSSYHNPSKSLRGKKASFSVAKIS